MMPRYVSSSSHDMHVFPSPYDMHVSYVALEVAADAKVLLVGA
jgi:hypothetical protein